MRSALVYYRYGPYHLARLRAARELIEVVGIELTSRDHIYQWDQIKVPSEIPFFSLIEPQKVSSASIKTIYEKVWALLSSVRPEVIAVPAWDTPFSLMVLRAAHTLNIPAIAMSESQFIDLPRHPIKEWVKSRLVELYSSAFVGGQPHQQYMRQLGMRPEGIFVGMDVIDNDHFAAAQRARSDPQPRALLASARFVEKKNLVGLLEAYKTYLTIAGAQAFSLTLLGDGPLRPVLESFVVQHGLANKVSMPGFVQYDKLPAYYARAAIFIHASTVEPWGLVVNEAMAAGLPVLVSNRCGCKEDLVQVGVNGYTFDPEYPERLAELILRVTRDPQALVRMGHASISIISEWNLGFFARQLCRAAHYAIEHPVRAAHSLRLRFIDTVAARI